MSWDSFELIAEYRSQGSKRVPTAMRGVDHFDHLLAYTLEFACPSGMVANAKRTRTTALWLTSYLAHWGMFRGSSELQRTNVVFFECVADALLNKRSGLLHPFFNVHLDDLANLREGEIKHVLTSVSVLLRRHGVSPTATLVSKLILGCTHTVPGYDRYVCDGLKRLRIAEGYEGSAAFSERGLRYLSKWYGQQKWPSVHCVVNGDLRIPGARLADMALSIYGGAK